MQVGAFQPFFRSHAHKETKRREPWIFGEEWTARFRKAVWMRYKILPYLYTLFQEGHAQGTPIMRPLWYEFPLVADLISREDSFMLGPALYVHPVIKKNMQQMKVDLPGKAGEDVWYRLENNWKQTTPGEHVVKAGLDDVLPVFIRGGNILLLQTRLRRSSKLMFGDPYTLVVAPDVTGQATGEVYFDDQQTLNHLKGSWHKVQFSFDGDKLFSTPDSSSSFRLPDSSVIERVLVLGTGTEASEISVETETSHVSSKLIQRSWGFELRKPNVHIMDRFTISLKEQLKAEL
jgi:alpha 1,3-glucosidase